LIVEEIKVVKIHESERIYHRRQESKMFRRSAIHSLSGGLEKSQKIYSAAISLLMRVIVAITGASGAIYALRLIEELKKKECEVHVILTEYGKKIMEHETDVEEEELENMVERVYHENDMDSPLASGSFFYDAMVVVPCSLRTLGGIASGIPSSLVIRASLCALKEGRKLVLVPRETPLDLISLENMVRVRRAGAVVLPAMPAFYHKPGDINELVNYVVGKIMEQIKMPHNLYKRWE